jgi:tetratricopeptide (TPR) repeat protein
MRLPIPRANKLFILFILLFVSTVLILLTLHPPYAIRVASANAHLKNWNLRQAEESLGSIVADNPDNLEVRRLYATTLLRRGELYKAHAELSTLLNASPNVDQSDHLNLAFTLFHLGKLDSSELIVREVLSHPDTNGKNSNEGRGFNLLGLIAFTRAQYDSAMVYQDRSLVLARRTNDLQAEANALRQIGALHWYAGRGDSIISAHYDSALILYRTVDDRIGEATTLDNMGFIFHDRLAIRHHLSAFAIRKRIGDKLGLASI